MRSELLLTFDVEADWGSERIVGVSEVLPRLLDVLARYEARATFFCVGRLAHELRQRLDPSGPHEVGSHGLTHRVLTQLSPRDVEREVTESRARLAECGYDVRGFRAPFLRAPKELPDLLAKADYTYDSSLGSVLPSLRNSRFGVTPRVESGVVRIPPSALRDRVTPFSLTAFRVLYPIARASRRRGVTMFFGHLHEFLPASPGWPGLPRWLGRLHARGTGPRAWRILERLLDSYRGATTTCREYAERYR